MENSFTRKNTNLEPILRITLMKYLEKRGLSVETTNKCIIPNTFGLIFDGWTCGTEHYIAIFAAWSDGKGNVTTILLCCGPQDEVDDDEMMKILPLQLSLSEITFSTN